jgi:hypothetical protein
LHRRTGKDYKIVKIRVSLVLPYKYGIEGRWTNGRNNKHWYESKKTIQTTKI